MALGTANRWPIDAAERVAWTFVQGALAEWILTQTLDITTLKIAGIAGLVSAVKCVLALGVGSNNTAAMLPVGEDTPRA